ncbi:Protein MKS1 [Apostasia shenzhenica]|uniref:Protein MKS1 n=1 Tax=Apostasia shenzhenica TaxID=1088818 RepID=A0A2I0A5T7_9ASPA|nr:Protein MKS1 [Apostasia shenzhenica]
MPSSSQRGLLGQRPHPLSISKESWKAGKPSAAIAGNISSGRRQSSPVIVYLTPPKIIHAKPQEFMGLVQRLTGKEYSGDSSPPPHPRSSGDDPLLLTLGQSPSAALWAADFSFSPANSFL